MCAFYPKCRFTISKSSPPTGFKEALSDDRIALPRLCVVCYCIFMHLIHPVIFASVNRRFFFIFFFGVFSQADYSPPFCARCTAVSMLNCLTGTLLLIRVRRCLTPCRFVKRSENHQFSAYPHRARRARIKSQH